MFENLRKRSALMLIAVCMVMISVSVLSPKTVEAASATKITIAKKATVKVGSKKKLSYKLTPGNASAKIQWSSSNGKVAKVTGKGVVKGIKKGTVTITAKVKGTNVTAKCKVNVKNVKVKSITAKAVSLKLGESHDLKPTVKPGNATNKKLKYTSSNTKVATVGKSNGKIVAKGVGTCNIKIAASDGSKKTKTIKVTVDTVKATKIAVGQTAVGLEEGGTSQINVIFTPANTTDKGLTYVSDNTGIATVSSTGLIKAVRKGTAAITVKTKDGSNKSATVKVTVDPIPATSMTASMSKTELVAGETVQISASVAPSNASIKDLKYTSSDPYAAEVSNTGEVTALAKGSTTITVETVDGTNLKKTFDIDVNYKNWEDMPRLIQTSDGEVDDMNSLVRYLLYANDYDIAGFVQGSSRLHWSDTTSGNTSAWYYSWAGDDWALDWVDAYAKVYDNLKVHDPNYPTPTYLKSVTVMGNHTLPDEMSVDTDGSELIKNAILDDDPRKLYVGNWGGTNTLARALYSIELDYFEQGTWAGAVGSSVYTSGPIKPGKQAEWDAISAKIHDKLIITAWGTQDNTYSMYIRESWPNIPYVDIQANDNLGWNWKLLANPNHPFLDYTLGTWLRPNIAQNHGALLNMYFTYGDGKVVPPADKSGWQMGTNDAMMTSWPLGGASRGAPFSRYDNVSEGDSPNFFIAINTGLSNLEDFTLGSWGGRYIKDTSAARYNSKGELANFWVGVQDYDVDMQADRISTAQFTPDLQLDFAARADWCVTPDYSGANHNPSMSIKEGAALTAAPGERVKLSATATDPDGDLVNFKWWHYNEEDSYVESLDDNGKAIRIALTGSDTDVISFIVPEDAKNGDTIHIIAKATDDGEQNLSYYQRVVITVEGSSVKPLEEITATLPSNEIIAGETAQISVTAQPTGALLPALKYTSSDPYAATVSNTGLVTAHAKGSTTITVETVDNSNLKKTFDVFVDYTDEQKASKPRVVATTDGEVDDLASMVRFLLYADEFDIQGIIHSASMFHWAGSENGPPVSYSQSGDTTQSHRWEGTSWIMEDVEAYEEVYPNLRVHNPMYPTPNYLKSVVKVGNIGYVGEMDGPTDGSNLIKDLILDDDPRKLYLTAWGGPNTIAMALKQIEDEYKSQPGWDELKTKISDKVVISAWGTQDYVYWSRWTGIPEAVKQNGSYISDNWPDLMYVNVSDGFQFANAGGAQDLLGYGIGAAMGQAQTYADSKNPVVAQAGADAETMKYFKASWMYKNLDHGHGALLDKYPSWGDGTEMVSESGGFSALVPGYNWTGWNHERYDFISEGDTHAFVPLMDNGLRMLEDWSYGGYGGRYTKQTGETVGQGAGAEAKKNNSDQQLNYYLPRVDYSSARGRQEFSGHKWLISMQKEFATKADWCISPTYDGANHKPDIMIDKGLDIEVQPGEPIVLKASASDPDGDYVDLKWWQYYEAGKDIIGTSSNELLTLSGANGNTITFTVPASAQDGTTYHLIAEGTDDGEHNLTYYQRVILTVRAEPTDSIVVNANSGVTNNTINLTDTNALRTLTAVSKNAAGDALAYKTVTWSSSDETIATIASNGRISILAGASGEVTFKATANDGSGKQGEITLTVVG